MDITKWSKRQRLQALMILALLLVSAMLVYQARAALLPFILGSIFVYIMLPLINWLDSRLRPVFHRRRVARSLAVLLAYVLAIGIVIGSLAFIIPPFATEVSVLGKRLPQLAREVYSAAPDAVRLWLDRYNHAVPEEIRTAIERSVQDTLQSVISAIQGGLFRTVSVLFSTVSFVLGLLIVPLWMFYILRDQPEMDAALYGLIPAPYREDVRSIRALVDAVLGAYLRRQLILCLSVGLMFTIGLEILRIDFALLLGTIVGILEIVPVLGPILGAIPALVLTLAIAPSKLLWVVLLAFAVQQIENNLLVPQVTQGTVRLHPAIVMVVLVVGSGLAGVAGVLLSVPVTAIVHDLVRYLYWRLAEEPLSPEEALLRVRNVS